MIPEIIRIGLLVSVTFFGLLSCDEDGAEVGVDPVSVAFPAEFQQALDAAEFVRIRIRGRTGVLETTVLRGIGKDTATTRVMNAVDECTNGEFLVLYRFPSDENEGGDVLHVYPIRHNMVVLGVEGKRVDVPLELVRRSLK